MDNKITLGYWHFKGLGQVPRFLLEYTGLPYEDKQYSTEEEWAKDKASIDFDFPNLPYIIDGDYKLTESAAIWRWIASKAKDLRLLGGNESDQIQVQMLLGVFGDIAQTFFKIAFAPKDAFEATKAAELSKIAPKFALLSKYLGKKEWLVGYITIADFQAAYILDVYCKLESKFLNEWKNLEELHERFFNIDKIKSYIATDRYPKCFLPPFATWTG